MIIRSPRTLVPQNSVETTAAAAAGTAATTAIAASGSTDDHRMIRTPSYESTNTTNTQEREASEREREVAG
jgi:hypothetical protein